ncbi:tetratricopeptide repeat protein [Polyangium mundeleinium]|uniref:Tetratricopeptide repeat protein n=1 Tax=Polyangium mundeleinium TaxID=2995306 RepID=A0ABT5EFF6_9BACT|nr:tetratricopeptide repeat protein [Polyangium mundeleinium]MDC0739983.1 tetratricopeptide repeat protein [Polyangium mundeleinium]
MDERLKDLLRVAREHYQRRDYDRAEPALREALALHGELADVHDMLGVILHDRGDLLGARFHFANAARINPAYTEALMNLAVTHADLGDYEAAREVYRRIQSEHTGTTSDPFVRGKIANMHADLAQAYLDAGSPRDAIAELRRAVDLCPRFPDLQARLGNLYRDQGNHALAREHYTSAIEANPRYAPAHVLLGLTMLALGSPDQAVTCFRAALSVDPDNKSAKMYLRLVEAQRNARAAKQPRRSREGASTPT